MTLEQAWAHFHHGDLHSAEVQCRAALRENSAMAAAWHLLALLAERAARPDDALDFVCRAIVLAPLEPAYWNQCALLHESRGELSAAERCLREALDRKPDYAIGLNNLGEVLRRWGRTSEALAAYERALELQPGFAAARSNLLMSTLYDPGRSGASIIAEHRRVAAWWDSSSNRLPRNATTRDANRPLRIGYMSPDLREHAVARFFEPLLAAHDRSRFEVTLYSECPLTDEVGKRLRRHGDTWRVTWQKSSAEVAAQIETDRIDLLIDLAGHTRNNRLDVFALRPAAVQATYLGYPGITGLSAIDFRLTDAVLNPPEPNEVEPPGAGERLIRIASGYACFQGPIEAPDVVAPPCLTRGHVTFASHHPVIKLNDALLRTWAEILRRLPDARLVFARSELVGDVADRLRERINNAGLDMARCELRAIPTDSPGYLTHFQDFDMVLDAFPFNGHTMTCEALWMGVPVVALRGDRPAGRLSASVLTVLGLGDLIADSTEGYIESAVRWARNVDRRATLRSELRQRVAERLGGAAWISGYEAALLRCLE